MILQPKPKTNFDITNSDHLTAALMMIKTNKWGPNGCPFRVSPGYVSIIEEIRSKIIDRLITRPNLIQLLTEEQ